VVTRAVWAGYSSAIKHEGYPGVVQGNIHEDLIESTVHEGCINGNYRMQPAKGHACRRSYGVLLCNANVKNAGWVLGSEFV
jgi:hypothetical protein